MAEKFHSDADKTTYEFRAKRRKEDARKAAEPKTEAKSTAKAPAKAPAKSAADDKEK
jgi:hypothetical protein